MLRPRSMTVARPRADVPATTLLSVFEDFRSSDTLWASIVVARVDIAQYVVRRSVSGTRDSSCSNSDRGRLRDRNHSARCRKSACGPLRRCAAHSRRNRASSRLPGPPTLRHRRSAPGRGRPVKCSMGGLSMSIAENSRCRRSTSGARCAGENSVLAASSTDGPPGTTYRPGTVVERTILSSGQVMGSMSPVSTLLSPTLLSRLKILWRRGRRADRRLSKPQRHRLRERDAEVADERRFAFADRGTRHQKTYLLIARVYTRE